MIDKLAVKKAIKALQNYDSLIVPELGKVEEVNGVVYLYNKDGGLVAFMSPKAYKGFLNG